MIGYMYPPIVPDVLVEFSTERDMDIGGWVISVGIRNGSLNFVAVVVVVVVGWAIDIFGLGCGCAVGNAAGAVAVAANSI